MRLSLRNVGVVARRDYLATVRRPGFLFTLLGTPLLYAVLMVIVVKPQQAERVGALKNFTTLGVVDSSGRFADAPRETWTDLVVENPFSAREKTDRSRYRTEVRFFDDLASARRALEAEEVTQVLVIPAGYPASAALRRYARSNNLFSGAEERVIGRWLVRGLLAGRVDSVAIERIAQPLRGETLYTLGRDGRFELKDDARELVDFLLPFALGLLLGLSIVIGGQYLLQGVNEEKESRILESMLCAVSPEEFLGGKLVGLGGAGLTLVLGWLAMASAVATPGLGALQIQLPFSTVLLMIAYFVLGYLFYGSLMMGIGAVASNLREATQFAVWFTFITFVPFYLLPTLMGHPEAPLSVILSLFPPTAPVTTMLRLGASTGHVPGWQIGLSLLLLAGSAVVVLLGSARVFRVGMLMYGKTPNLPEIIRWVRQP